MVQIIRETFSASEKAQVALEALRENMKVNEITKKYGFEMFSREFRPTVPRLK